MDPSPQASWLCMHDHQRRGSIGTEAHAVNPNKNPSYREEPLAF